MHISVTHCILVLTVISSFSLLLAIPAFVLGIYSTANIRDTSTSASPLPPTSTSASSLTPIPDEVVDNCNSCTVSPSGDKVGETCPQNMFELLSNCGCQFDTQQAVNIFTFCYACPSRIEMQDRILRPCDSARIIHILCFENTYSRPIALAIRVLVGLNRV